MKKAFTLVELIGAIIILGMIALLAFPPLLNMIRGTNEEIDKASQTLLFTAVDQYIDSNKNEFPKTDGNTFCVSYGDLIKSENISNNIPNKSGNTIDANTMIKVLVNNGKYEYSIDNSCERIVKSSLVDLLKQQYRPENENGLLKDPDSNDYYYKGTNEEVSNNFVWFGGHLWRVLTINEDNTLTMITQQPLTAISTSNTGWTTEEEFKNSNINRWLNDAFLYNIETNDINQIMYNTFNVGGKYSKISQEIENIDSIQTVGKVGLLDSFQYKRAGEKDSFLDIKNYFWLGNTVSESSAIVSVTGELLNHSASMEMGVRPVIKVSNLIVTEGEGTLKSPYREKSATTNTSNIKIGEYVSVPTSGSDCGDDNRCLFRVVSKDNDSIKIILNGLLPRAQLILDSPYTKGNAIDTVVTTFANTIDNQYRYTGNKSFNIGACEYGWNYTAVQDTKYTGTEENPVNVGLPVIGEMFSGNDINITKYSFVNIDTIENPTNVDYFWLMNIGLRYVTNNGALNGSGLSDPSYQVRPVMFLKNNLTFASGEGTAENPFVLE